MPITAKLDEFGKPAWIALTVLGFMAWWPLGLAILAFTIRERKNGMRISRRLRPLAAQDGSPAVARWTGCAHVWAVRAPAAGSWRWQRYGPSSGNSAFDDYRSETLKRLEDEQREFKDFLERLRFAKDKTEFDQPSWPSAATARRRNSATKRRRRMASGRMNPRLRRTNLPLTLIRATAVRLPRGGRPFLLRNLLDSPACRERRGAATPNP